MLGGVSHEVLQCLCFACQPCENTQFTCTFECHLCLLSAFVLSPPSLLLAMVSNLRGGQYLH